MKRRPALRRQGFTLIEILIALLILSTLALMSYRGLGAVLDAREYVSAQTRKWQELDAFFSRFGQDLKLAAARPARRGGDLAPAWRGGAPGTAGPRLEFSRFASAEGVDRPRRIAYHHNEQGEIELWLWVGLDLPSGAEPQRHAVLTGVESFELRYMNEALVWAPAWPTSPLDPAIPRAVQLRLVLASGEALIRTYALRL